MTSGNGKDGNTISSINAKTDTAKVVAYKNFCKKNEIHVLELLKNDFVF